jgi:hypothetical protein
MTTQPRIGRPPKKVVGKGRSNVNFQINAQLRRELVETAAKNNRSLGGQIELYIADGLAAEKQRERMRRRTEAYRDGTLPAPFSEEATQGPLTPELVERYAAVDRGYVTWQELDARLKADRDERFEAERAEIQQMVDEVMRKSVAELIAPKKDDAA